MSEPTSGPEAGGDAATARAGAAADAPEAVSFEAALAELEEIVEAVSEDRIGIDELGGKVARGAELVRACRRHLDAADVEVTRVTEELARLGLRETADRAGAEGGTGEHAPAGESDDEEPDRGDVPF